MIKNYEKLRIPDESKLNDMLIEVNWSPYDKSSMDCRLIRVTLGGQTAVIRKDHFMGFLFTIGTQEEQRKMIPTTERRSRWYETVISVKAKKDIRKGEDITFPLKLTLPTMEQEAISELKRDMIKK